ncbi:MAG: hypothetical protein K2I74_09550 [Treponemataceae bacterium]|nr:hypothetical protein [Treponemataceae bacterium]
MTIAPKLFCGIVFSCLLTATAETFRVRATVPLALNDITDEAQATATMNDALLITLPADMTYVSGVELKFKIPETVAAWRDTIAYSLYDDIRPRPSAQTVDYEGTRISVNTFPGKLSHIVSIPLAENSTVKHSPYQDIIAARPDTKNGYVFFRMQLAMKGAPESLENAVFAVTAKPVLLNKGTLRLLITEPDGAHKPYTVMIDEKAVTPQGGMLIDTGEHHLSITSDEYRNEVRTFRIEQAKTTELTVAMRGIEPLLKIISPNDARIFLDGEPLANTKEPLTVTPGDHTVRFMIGDYEVVRTVSAANGRSYTVHLSVDAAVTEDDETQ